MSAKASSQDLVTVTMQRWMWIYFLGWLEGKRSQSSGAETAQITTALESIAAAVKS